MVLIVVPRSAPRLKQITFGIVAAPMAVPGWRSTARPLRPAVLHCRSSQQRHLIYRYLPSGPPGARQAMAPRP